MKNLKALPAILVMLITALSVPADAQGLSGLMKKAKNAAQKVDKVLNQTAEKTDEALASRPVTLENGIQIINPLSSSIEIEPVGLYGVATSENFGNCYLVLRAKMLLPKSKTNFGSIGSEKMIAVGNNGKTYPVDASGSIPYDTPEGIMVNITLDHPAIMFENVKQSVTEMQIVKVGVFIDASTKAYITLKNVPILWNETPEVD